VVSVVAELMGKQLEVTRDEQRVRPTNSEVQRLVSDPRLARELMGWEPSVTLRDGVAQTIDWIRENLDRYALDEYVI
jgi:nucleoside-diphosphate-sugar epimerase